VSVDHALAAGFLNGAPDPRELHILRDEAAMYEADERPTWDELAEHDVDVNDRLQAGIEEAA
jgi:hypothetical protein